ncbi:helix-turn-helix transcriptional regulator [Ornithinibacillus scapharcae]|uniref:helix-turn-helix transcriptional regulator n=1 Tax=Ornithinibacillus scapharcae TaxID=1147159 RepID=UPI000225B834|nr:YafY family protein [Ornithinibacillus scapharcae]
MRLHRLISILLLVESRGTIKANELSTKLEVSDRTIYRDIDTLCEAGFPLVTTTGPNGGVRFMDGYSVGISNLREEDFVNLYLSGIGIQPVKESNMSSKLTNALLKLQKNAPVDLDSVRRRFYFDESPWWGSNVQIPAIDILLTSVFKSKALEIIYNKMDGTSSQRKIHPYGIVVKRLDWYLVAFCENSNLVKIFKCERIGKVKVIDEEFYIPGNFPLTDYWNQSQQAFRDMRSAEEIYPVQLKIDKQNAHVLTDLEVINLAEEGLDLIVSINLFGPDHAIRETMKMLDYVEVIQPSELRDSIREKLELLIMKYS